MGWNAAPCSAPDIIRLSLEPSGIWLGSSDSDAFLFLSCGIGKISFSYLENTYIETNKTGNYSQEYPTGEAFSRDRADILIEKGDTFKGAKRTASEK
jgi:hypothetical protein